MSEPIRLKAATIVASADPQSGEVMFCDAVTDEGRSVRMTVTGPSIRLAMYEGPIDGSGSRKYYENGEPIWTNAPYWKTIRTAASGKRSLPWTVSVREMIELLGLEVIPSENPEAFPLP